MRETKSTSKSSIPTGWRRGVLSDYIAKKAKGIVPNKTPNARFELYSVPSHETGRPEIVSGSDIGSNKQIVDVGTVLLCKINPRINRSWVVSSHTGHQKIASTEWISFPPSDDFQPKYLAYYLNQESLRAFLAANASGVGGSLTRVKPSTIKEYPYPIAPIEQQRQIVAEIEKQFSRLDESVASLNRVRANLKRYKAAVLKAAIEGRLTEEWRKQNPDVEPASTLLERILAERRAKWEEAEFAKMRAKGKEPKDDTWKKKYRKAFDLDEKSQRALAPGWAWVSIEAILKTPEALSYGILKPGPFVTSGIPMVRVVDVGDGVIIPTEIVQVTEESAAPYERTRLENGDILLAVMATIGRAAIVPDFLTGANVNRALAVLKISRLLTSKFVLLVLLSPYFQNVFASSKLGSAQARINLGDLREFAFPLPPLAEQEQIVDIIDSHLSVLEKQEQALDALEVKLSQSRQSLLAAAFAGSLALGEF